ncbi:hypothetical protein [Ornithinimicrobium flavum]|uniref:hypothetical protein n=1 Tax=Ornithinimicrobium flavum TaxID=1288636 RepID=UPI00106F5505|nr:hypothetical protein [Ornithinimicrobium flavum]
MEEHQTPGDPIYDRRAEVEQHLAADETVLGRYWKYTQEGLSREEMAAREGLETSGWVSNYEGVLLALRDGRIATSPSGARQSAARIRSWLKKKPLSPRLAADLAEQERVLAAIADDREAQEAEDARAVQASKEAEAALTPGIYVYSLPHYLKHPFDPDSGRTLLKVGHSGRDAYYRVSSQGRLTALPEDPILLRIYPAEESANVEAQFHAWLRDADHPGSRSRRGGAEWFVTSTKFLDRVASSLGLEIRAVNEMEVFGE